LEERVVISFKTLMKRLIYAGRTVSTNTYTATLATTTTRIPTIPLVSTTNAAIATHEAATHATRRI
jgi:hypothetical protein